MSMEKLENFGNFIKYFRNKLGFKGVSGAKKFANALKISLASVYNWEKRHKIPPSFSFDELSNIFKIDSKKVYEEFKSSTEYMESMKQNKEIIEMDSIRKARTIDINMNGFYEKLNHIINEAQIDLEKLSMDIDIPEESLKLITRRKILPTVIDLYKLSLYFDVPMEWFLTGDDYIQKLKDENKKLRLEHEKDLSRMRTIVEIIQTTTTSLKQQLISEI